MLLPLFQEVAHNDPARAPGLDPSLSHPVGSCGPPRDLPPHMRHSQLIGTRVNVRMLGTDLTKGLNDPNSRDHPSRGYAEAHLPGCRAALAGEHRLEIDLKTLDFKPDAMIG